MTDESIDDCELSQGERNRFFHGKLMTARDMAAEQQYHRGLFTTQARNVAGHGVVEGLEVSFESADEGVEVIVSSGYAIDCCGRPVVVATGTKDTLARPSNPDEVPLGVFIEYDECLTETVPIPGSEDACERECAYNRVIETYDVTLDPVTDPEAVTKPVPHVTFPSRDELATGETLATAELEELYREAAETAQELEERVMEGEVEGPDPQAQLDLTMDFAGFLERLLGGDRPDVDELRTYQEQLFEDLGVTEPVMPPENAIEWELLFVTRKVNILESLGARQVPAIEDIGPYEPELASIAQNWEESPPVGCEDQDTIFLGLVPDDTGVDWAFEPARPLLYSNDLLYAAIARHTADFRNPHDVVSSVNDMTGGVEFISSNNSVTVDERESEGIVDLTAEGGGERDDIALREHVVAQTYRTYQRIADELANGQANNVANRANDIIGDQSVIADPVEFIDRVLQNQEISLCTVQSSFERNLPEFVGRRDRYAELLDELEGLRERSGDAKEIAREVALAQLRLTAAADGLEGKRVNFRRFMAGGNRVTLPLTNDWLVIDREEQGQPPRFRSLQGYHNVTGLVFDDIRLGFERTRRAAVRVSGPYQGMTLEVRSSRGDFIREYQAPQESEESTNTFDVDPDQTFAQLHLIGGGLEVGIVDVGVR